MARLLDAACLSDTAMLSCAEATADSAKDTTACAPEEEKLNPPPSEQPIVQPNNNGLHYYKASHRLPLAHPYLELQQPLHLPLHLWVGIAPAAPLLELPNEVPLMREELLHLTGVPLQLL